MISKLFFILVCIVSVIYCVEVCTNKSPCKCVLAPDKVIDISTVGKVGLPRFFEIEGVENDTHRYSYNPCYSFSSPGHQYTIQNNGNKPCVDAAACVRSPGGSNGSLPEEYAIGIQSEGKFGVMPGKDTQYHINYTVPGVKGMLRVMLKCTKKADEHLLSVETPKTDGSDLIVMTLSSKCACPNLCGSANPEPSNEGLSTGSKLLIAFFTIVLAYFLIGMGWNFCNGAHGPELIPNYEFWNELPKLIIEGVAFTCSCCGKKTAYGEV